MSGLAPAVGVARASALGDGSWSVEFRRDGERLSIAPAVVPVFTRADAAAGFSLEVVRDRALDGALGSLGLAREGAWELVDGGALSCVVVASEAGDGERAEPAGGVIEAPWCDLCRAGEDVRSAVSVTDDGAVVVDHERRVGSVLELEVLIHREDRCRPGAGWEPGPARVQIGLGADLGSVPVDGDGPERLAALILAAAAQARGLR